MMKAGAKGAAKTAAKSKSKKDKAPPAPPQSKASGLKTSSAPLDKTVLESMLPPVKKAKRELPTEKMSPMASGQPSGTAEPLPKPSAEPAVPLPTPSAEPASLLPPELAKDASNKSDAADAISPSAKIDNDDATSPSELAADAAAMPPPPKGAPVRAPEGLVSPAAQPPPPSPQVPGSTVEVMREAVASMPGTGSRPRSDEFKAMHAAKQRFNRLEKTGKLSKKVLLDLATEEGKTYWWLKFQKDPDCLIKAEMTSEFSNVEETINEEGMGWMTHGQIEKMMNCPVVAAEMKAEATRRPKHMKKNKFLPDDQSEKAMLYLVPLTAKEKAMRRSAESNVQKFAAEADPDDAIELAKQIHAAASSGLARGEAGQASGLARAEAAAAPGDPPPTEDAAKKAAEAKQARIKERERLKNLPSNKAAAWIQQCNQRLSDLSTFDAKLEQSKSRLNADICSAYQRQLKDLIMKTKDLRQAVEAASEGHEDARILELLATASEMMDKAKAATAQITSFIKEPKAKAAPQQ